MKFRMNLAQLKIDVLSGDDYTKERCLDYLVEDDGTKADIIVNVEDEDVLPDKDFSFEFRKYYRTYCMISEQLPRYDCCMFHGAVITFNEDGYLFTAPSGTGKTTHICLWKKYLGTYVNMVNGDKPILHVNGDSVIAYGAPWCGKEKWNRNCSAPLKGICIVERGEVNSIERISPQDAVLPFYKQIYLPQDGEAKLLSMGILDKIVRSIPVYVLKCDMSEDAVKTSFEAMTHRKFEDYRKTEER